MFHVRRRLCALFLALAGICASAQDNIATAESAMLDQVRATDDSAVRIPLLLRFIEQHPRSKSLLWALKALQSDFQGLSEFRRAIEIGQKAINLYPADIEVAENNLRLAERISDSALIRKYAVDTWRRAYWLRRNPGAVGQAARESMDFAESQLAYSAVQDSEPENRRLALETLGRLNPESAYLPNLTSTADRVANSGVSRTPPPLPPDFSIDIGDADSLLAEAERLTRRGTNYSKVFEYAQRALRLLEEQTGPPPEEDAESWQVKHSRRINAARWMSGMAATFTGRYQTADRDLRAALPSLRGNAPALGITLYSLGYVNYQLAEAGQRKRIFEALAFNRECAAFPNAYREQALKNIEAIRMFYNMQ